MTHHLTLFNYSIHLPVSVFCMILPGGLPDLSGLDELSDLLDAGPPREFSEEGPEDGSC